MLETMTAAALLERLEDYYDTVPRATSDVVAVPGFTMFVARYGWRFYGRPRPGTGYAAEDVRRVREELMAHGVPDQLEWVDELVPTLRRAAVAAGMTVHANPLLVLARPVPVHTPADVDVSVLDPDDPRVADVRAAVDAGFGGTDLKTPEPVPETIRQLSRDGLLVMAGAFEQGEAIGGGTHAGRGDVSELMGIATLPGARRRGVGTAVTVALTRDALSRGVTTVFLSAGSAQVARVYEQVGFVRVGTACVAEG